MNLEALITSPAPLHAFAIEPGALAYGRSDRRRADLERIEVATLPGGWYSLGPVGVLHVNREVLGHGLAELLGRLEKRPARASVAVPDGWLRSVIVDVGTLPRRRDEAEEVVRWRLKKLLPCRPEEVRLDYFSSGEEDRVVVMLALDRPMVAVEETFGEAGIEIGRLTSAAVALSGLAPDDASSLVLATVTAGTLAMTVTQSGVRRAIRLKGLPDDPEKAAVTVQRELGQTVAFARERARDGEETRVWLACEEPRITAAVTEWALAETDTRVEAFGEPGDGAGAGIRAYCLKALCRERVR